MQDKKCCKDCNKRNKGFRFNVLQTLSIIMVGLACIFAYYKLGDVIWLVLLQIYATCIIIRGYIA